MLDLIKYIVDHFAEDPANVDYNVVEKGNAVDVTILLSESDMGKVIGRQAKLPRRSAPSSIPLPKTRAKDTTSKSRERTKRFFPIFQQ